MLFLAGLLGMMALGSVVIVGTDDDAENGDDMVAGGPDQDQDPTADATEDGTGLTRDLVLVDDASDDTAQPDDGGAQGGGAHDGGAQGGAPGQATDGPAHMPDGVSGSEVPDWIGSGAGPIPGAGDVQGDTGGGGADGGSLFARLGLINMPGFTDAPVVDQNAEPPVDPDSGVNVSGVDGNDTMTGTGATDLLGGDNGDDLLSGLGGADELHGGDGDDTIDGGGGDDTLHGDGGADVLNGGAGDDTLFGHHGDDSLYGGNGADSLIGGLGEDALDGGAGDDALHGREGADTLSGGLGSDTLFGGWDNDVLNGVVVGADGTDVDTGDFLNGGDGDDTIVAGSGDTLHGGAGADVLVLGHWMTGDNATLADNDAEQDQLMIVYDDAGGVSEPEVEMRMSDTDPDVTEILMDGHVLVSMPTADAPPLHSLVLVGESVAAQMAVG